MSTNVTVTTATGTQLVDSLTWDEAIAYAAATPGRGALTIHQPATPGHGARTLIVGTIRNSQISVGNNRQIR